MMKIELILEGAATHPVLHPLVQVAPSKIPGTKIDLPLPLLLGLKVRINHLVLVLY